MRPLGWKGHPTAARLAACKPGPSADMAHMFRSMGFGVDIPVAVDLRENTMELDQDPLGSCTAQAIAGAIRSELVAAEEALPPLPSRLMIYVMELIEEGNPGQDVGAHICTGFDAVSRFGWAPEELWPYDPAWLKSHPVTFPQAFRYAMDNRGALGIDYHQIAATGQARVLQTKRALAAGHCVPWGTLLTERECSEEPTGVVHVPSPLETIAGGHARLLCGYDDAGQFFWCRESWGKFGERGTPGFTRIGYDRVAWSESGDFWFCTLKGGDR